MITFETIMSIPKSDLEEKSKTLCEEEISQLVEWLALKDDNIRYQALLLLQNRSLNFNDVYQYWNVFRSKLSSDNSYQRSIGLMLISENVKWDKENLMEDTIDEYLLLLNDEKPITIRQTIQALGKIVLLKPNLKNKIASKLMVFDLTTVKETMRKSILLDIINVLLIIRKIESDVTIEDYIQNVLNGEILDKKSKKEIATHL